MLTLKYIRIRKDRPAEQCLSSIWCDACANFEMPCVLIYLDQDSAYISASLKHLPPFTISQQQASAIEEKLQLIQLNYTATAKGYWKHSSTYFTFDSLPLEIADEAAAAIFEALNAYLSQFTHQFPKLTDPDNQETTAK